jgi:hypothetical protein
MLEWERMRGFPIWNFSKLSSVVRVRTSAYRWLGGIFGIFALLMAAVTTAAAATGVNLAWDPNPESDIAGYRVHYGTAPGTYTKLVDVGNLTNASINDLTPGGTYFFTVSAYNSEGLEGPPSDEVSTTYDPAPIDADHNGLPDDWEAENGLTQSGIVNGGASGDPDHDTIPNLVEYGMNLAPVVADPPPLTPIAIASNPADGKHYLNFSYRRRTGNSGLTYAVQVSSDMATWSSTPERFEEIGSPVSSPDGKTELVTVRIKPALEDASQPQCFVRLAINFGQ